MDSSEEIAKMPTGVRGPICSLYSGIPSGVGGGGGIKFSERRQPVPTPWMMKGIQT